MWVQSHLLLAVVVFGPRPEALLGSFIPDILSYTNWGTKFLQGKLNRTILLQGEVRVNDVTNDGFVWEAHTFLHSFWIAGLTLGGAIFFAKTNPSLSIFLGSYFLHIFVDYFTHKIRWWPLIPWKGWKTSFGIYEYGLRNWRFIVLGDLLLGILAVIRLFYWRG